MKQLIALAIIALTLTTSAGTLNMSTTAKNISRNAGEYLPVNFGAKGFPAGSTYMVTLINAKTWQSTSVAYGLPLVNGANSTSIQIDWSWWEAGVYLIRVDASPRAHVTSSHTVRIRSAVLWPYGGTVFRRGSGAWIYWTTPWPIAADFLSVTLASDDGGGSYSLNDYVNPSDGSLFFEVPDVVGDNFRIYLEGWFDLPEELQGFDFPTDSTHSEKFSIR